MARGTDFGGVHSSRDLRLIQQKVDIQPAEPKLNLVDIPGANGSKDMTDRPSGRVVYKDRKITWRFALYPGEPWGEKHREVSNALNGRFCHITLDSDPDYYFEGRLVVKKYNVDKVLRQITVEASCRPYMMKQTETVAVIDIEESYYQDYILINQHKPVVPTIVTTVAVDLFCNGVTRSLPVGTTKDKDILLLQGNNVLRMRAANEGEAGEVTFVYQEGSL